MRAEHLRDASRPCAFLCLEFFEKADCSARIVAGFVQILQSEIIGLGFIAARELEELQRDEEPRSLPNSKPADSTHKDQRN